MVKSNDMKGEIRDLFQYLGIQDPFKDPNIPEKDSPFSEVQGKYRVPTKGNILSRHHPISQGGFATPTHPEGHEGFDIGNSKGTPIYAIGPGVVTKIYDEGNNKGGNAVITSHEDGQLTSYYAHLDSVDVNIGDEVDQNTMVGTMGTSGNARGVSHLHWHMRMNGTPVDPEGIIGKNVGFSRNASREERLTKLARRHRMLVWQRLLLTNL